MFKALSAAGLALAALGGFLPAAAPAAAAPAAHRPSVVAFNWWQGNHERKTYFGSVRAGTLGGGFGEPVTSLHWQSWTSNGATGTGLVVHMSCQPCHVTVSLSHVQSSSRGRFFAWMNVDYGSGDTIRLRWSFQHRNWVGR
jgi:hypothetical protein